MSSPALHCVGLVACGKAKVDHPAAARDLYTGGLFRAAAAYAAATYDEWYILSAAHGLVDPDQQLAPYDRSMRHLARAERATWGARTAGALQSRLHAQGLSVPTVPRGRPWPHDPQVEIWLHAGEVYVRALWFDLALFPAVRQTPLEGLRIGEQLRWYAQRRDAP